MKKNSRQKLKHKQAGKIAAKVWAGRFGTGPAALMEKFSRSIASDGQLWREDVQVNQAWAKALVAAGILSVAENKRIQAGLQRIAREFRAGRFPFLPQDEDIHVAIERRLTELAGEAGAKIHTGRSRNDQVVTDFRLYLKRKTRGLQAALHTCVAVLVQQAEAAQQIILPGYTHTQRAQPVRLAHYLLSAFPALRRHHHQLQDFLQRVDELPLGAGAVAGTAFAIDRRLLAAELGFRRLAANSIDATGSRSFCNEITFVCADLGTTLSRYAHDFILWSTQEFGFLDPGEKFATGSSMMPNKKNPDAFELVRGKAAHLIGLLTAMLTLQKGTPVTYNRDLQEDKRIVFDALQTAQDCLEVFAGALATSRFRPERMQAAIDSSLFATDIADHLVRKGVPFRQAHHLVARAVRHCEVTGCSLQALPLSFWQELHPACDGEIFNCFTAEASVERRAATGGTALAQVKRQLREARAWLDHNRG
ncbi:MAG: argininosuccinate lyase [candidate division KSB1 bacterium]|nr:argininosuccinate lyase [candidate division KSB1 bacterium]MDZ7273849.1 argininosuccinate lyase [candidate division KSB1 bacterium]MDZ7286005.1 argininosuccinate lyase [candidate division KSB1 bacterium]MDZ7299037.1 argininosuccinate lyase [candidate division KSB1 bacterium]MDZ7307992.1 argininosuccinate lyase [candidate division KSB1 bacterium]